MTISEQSVRPAECWHVEVLPGDGLIAPGSHHVLVVEVDADISNSGLADRIVAAYDAHSRLLGRGAARSLQVAVAAILAEHEGAHCAVALVSVWDDKIAVYLHGEAIAVLQGRQATISLDGRGSLVATDAVLSNDFDHLEVFLGQRVEDNRTPLHIGQIASGGGVRLTFQRSEGVVDSLNEWADGQ